MPLKILLQKNKIYQKQIKKDYDVEIAFLEGPITRLFSIKNRNIKKIAWIHNDIALVFGKGIKAKIKAKIDEKIYSQYEKLIFVSQENLENFENTYPNLKNDKQVIYNYIEKKKILEKSKQILDVPFKAEEINFVTVARLVEQKGIDRLIEVHNQLIKNNLLHHFYVIGEGLEREKLQKEIQERKLEKTFTLLGKKENPYPYIKQADYFCLLSKFEGYGMVIEEAKILNKPIVITDTAAREAIKGYQQATIVENTKEGIYKGLKKIIDKNKQEIKSEYNKEEKEYNNQEIIEKIRELIEG